MTNLWKQDYLLNLDEIDEQHQYFFKILAKLSEYAAKPEKSRQDVQAMFKILLEFRTYGYHHFYTEEMLMIERGYPDFLEHMAVHDRYIAAMSQKKDEFVPLYKGLLSGEVKQSEVDIFFQDIMEYIGSWYSQHIMSQDAKYAHFIKTKGKK